MAHVKYFWDEIEDNVVREYDENNNTLASYTTEPTAFGTYLGQDHEGESHYYHFDGQGNTAELTNLAGAVTDMRRYTAFGLVVASITANQFPWQWIGAFDYSEFSTAQSYHVRRRMLNSSHGRWLSVDPLTWPNDNNLFRYSRNSPSLILDPTGLDTEAHRRFQGYYAVAIRAQDLDRIRWVLRDLYFFSRCVAKALRGECGECACGPPFPLRVCHRLMFTWSPDFTTTVETFCLDKCSEGDVPSDDGPFCGLVPCAKFMSWQCVRRYNPANNMIVYGWQEVDDLDSCTLKHVSYLPRNDVIVPPGAIEPPLPAGVVPPVLV